MGDLLTGFDLPSLGTLITRAEQDLLVRLGGQETRIRRAFPYVLARVWAGTLWTLYRTFPYTAEQALPDRARDDLLDRHADVYGLTRQPPARASGTVLFTGTDGTSIPKGTTVERVADGVAYDTTEAATIGSSTSGEVEVAAEAAALGAAGNAQSGTLVDLAQSISGVDDRAEVAQAMADGADVEADASFRRRLLDRIALQPRGGSPADLEHWVRETPDVDVDEVWVDVSDDANRVRAPSGSSVFVRFTLDKNGTRAKPLSSDVSAVRRYVGSRVRRPVAQDLHVIEPDLLQVEVDVDASELELERGVSQSQVETAITNELAAEIRARRRPGTRIYNSQLRDAISRATGERSHRLADLRVGGSSVGVLGDVVQGPNDLAYTNSASVSFV